MSNLFLSVLTIFFVLFSSRRKGYKALRKAPRGDTGSLEHVSVVDSSWETNVLMRRRVLFVVASVVFYSPPAYPGVAGYGGASLTRRTATRMCE